MTVFIIYALMLAVVTAAIVIAVLLGDRAISQHENATLKRELAKEKAFSTTKDGAIKTYAETAKAAVDALHGHLFPKEKK